MNDPAARAVADGDGSTPDLGALRGWAVAELAHAGVAAPEVDAELLLAHALGLPRGALRLQLITGAAAPSAAQAARFRELVRRRAGREPLQHLTGTAAFRSLELAVGPGVFVPRPETETVVQHAIDRLRESPAAPLAVDLGTGSGAIALAMATEVPRARVVAVERSHLAYTWARQNVRAAGAANLRLVLADLAEAVPELDGEAEVVISNPPYIPDAAVPRDPEVRRHDPAEALYGGPDGLEAVRAVAARALRLLRSGGLLVLEHGEEQGAAVRALLEATGFTAARTYPDLTFRDRATLALR